MGLPTIPRFLMAGRMTFLKMTVGVKSIFNFLIIEPWWINR